MPGRTFILLPMLLSSIVATFAGAQEPASTQPATAPSTEPTTRSVWAPAASEWPSLIERLGDADPSVRAEARFDLMRISRDDLPALADAARTTGPLLPTQRSLLREVVLQIYLVGQHNFEGDGPGYLGVTISQLAGVDATSGIVVQDRLPGYDAVRALELNDVITAVSFPRGPQKGFQAVRDQPQLRAALGWAVPGDEVRVKLLRDGVELEIAMRVGPLPPEEARVQNNPAVRDMWRERQHAEAARYWTQTFEPRLRSDAATAPAAEATSRR